MNKKFLLLFSAISILGSYGAVEAQYDFKVANRKLHVGAFFQNQSALRFENELTDEGVTLPLFRNTAQIEWNLEFNRYISLAGIYRGVYEGSLDFDDNLSQFLTDDLRDDLRWESDLREFYFDINAGNWDFRLGKQQVVWGESDGLRLADIINPLDLRWHYFLESFEDLRIPMWMAKIDYSVPTFNDFNIELIYIPVDFEPAVVAPFNANWAFPFPEGGPPVNITDRAPKDSDFENGEVGLRVRGLLGDWEVSGFGFYTRADAPVVQFEGIDPDPFAINLGLVYNRVRVFGGTFNKYSNSTETVFRGEFTYTSDQPYNSVDAGGAVTIVDKGTINYVLGFDRPTMLPINSNRSVLLSGQLFQTIVLDHDDSLVLSGLPTKQEQVKTTVTFYTSTGYKNDTIFPELLLIYDFSNQGWIQPKLRYIWGDYWQFTIGANILFGDELFDGPFGFFRNNDEMFFNVRYAF